MLAALALISQLVSAASPEGTYFAERDAAVAKFTKLVKRSGPTDPVLADEKAERAELGRKLHAIIGQPAIAGMSGDGQNNVSTLIEGDEDFGSLDALRFERHRVRWWVTTEPLLRHWLREHQHWWKDEAMPQEIRAAGSSAAFYTQATGSEAAVSRYAALPLHKADNADFAVAILAARSQDEAPSSASEVFVMVEQGGRVFIGNEAVPEVGPIAECDAVRHAAPLDALRTADAAMLHCFAAHAPHLSAFAEATRRAQALADRVGR